MTRRIGLLGGTFNPVHYGHLRSAIEVRERLGLDELRLVPSARPPHRDAPEVSAEQRLAMVQLALSNTAELSVDDRELQRDKPSWTVDTLASLRAELGADVPLFFILGWDAFCGLPGWHRWQELLGLAHLVILQRPDFDQDVPEALKDLLAARTAASLDAVHGAAGQIITLEQTPLAISATQIRHLIRHGQSARFLLPDLVLDYIHTHGLYRPDRQD